MDRSGDLYAHDDSVPLVFEWDQNKAKKNREESRPPFEAGMEAFLDKNRLQSFDQKHSGEEERFNVVGMVDGVCLFVTFTWRGKIGRLISAAPAEGKEKAMTVRKTLADSKAHPFRFSVDERRRLQATSEAAVHRQAKEDKNLSNDDDLARMVLAREVRLIRESTGLSQTDFAKRFDMTYGRLRDWEQGRSSPDQAMLNYLRLIRDEPRAVARILEKAG